MTKTTRTVDEDRGVIRPRLEIHASLPLFFACRNPDRQAVHKRSLFERSLDHQPPPTGVGFNQKLARDVIDEIASSLLFAKENHQAPPERVGLGVFPIPRPAASAEPLLVARPR
jgi:hypothetical protein